MKIVNIIRIACFVLGVLACFGANRLLIGCNMDKSTQPSTAAIISIQQQQKISQKIDSFEQHIEALAIRNVDLQSQVSETKRQLARVQKRSDNQSAQLRNHVENSRSLIDTAEIISICDSIGAASLDYIETMEVRDKLQIEYSETLQLQLDNRDSTIVQHRLQNNLLQLDNTLLNNSLSPLAFERDYFKTQLRKERRKGRLLGVGLLLLSGASTYMLLQH